MMPKAAPLAGLRGPMQSVRRISAVRSRYFSRMNRRACWPALGALLLVACGTDRGASASASTPSVTGTAAPSASAGASDAPSGSGAASEPTDSPGDEAVVVEPPPDLLPPGSLAVVKADGLRVRGGPPGSAEYDDIRATLNT